MGRSIREQAERSYLLHCKDAFLYLTCWGEWSSMFKGIWEAIEPALGLLLYLVCLVLFPITVPIAAYNRKRLAKKLLREWESTRKVI